MWFVPHCSEYEKEVKPLQEELVGKNFHEQVILHFAHPQDQVAIQAMAFLVALVYKGNKEAQQKIGQCLKNRGTELFTRMEAILKFASTCTRFTIIYISMIFSSMCNCIVQ